MESWGEWNQRAKKVAEDLASLLAEARDEGQLEHGEEVLNAAFADNDVPLRAVILETEDV